MLLKRIVAVFKSGVVSDGDEAEIKVAGKEDGKRLVAAWWEGAQEGVQEGLDELLPGLLTYDVVSKPIPRHNRTPEDFEDYTRPELMAKCKYLEIEYTKKDTVVSLVEKLCK